jgi:hypothetical protein
MNGIKKKKRKKRSFLKHKKIIEQKDEIQKQVVTIFDRIESKKVDIHCDGKGTMDDPFIIEPSEILPRDFELKELQHHFIIRDILDLNNIDISFSKHILIENCMLNHLTLSSCSETTVKKSYIVKDMMLNDCNDIHVENCEIMKMVLNDCQGDYIQSGNIHKIVYLN